MKKLPPTNTCRASPSRGSPSTEVIGIVLVDHRHVARLAALLFRLVRAVLPLEVHHLLGKLSDHLALRIERLGDERVAGRAQFGLPDVVALRRLELRRRPHDRRQTLLDVERTEDRPRRGLRAGNRRIRRRSSRGVPSFSLEI